MEEEFWIKKLRERLENYQAPLPDNGWDRLEKSIGARHLASRRVKRKIIIWSRSIVAVAAVLLLAVIISVKVTNRTDNHQVKNLAIDNKASMSQALSEETHSWPINRVNENEKNTMSHTKRINKNLLVKKEDVVDKQHIESIASDTVSAEKSNAEETQQKRQGLLPKTEKKLAYVSRPSLTKNKREGRISQTTKASKKWSFGLSVSNSGGATINNSTTNLLQSSFANVMNGALDLATTTNTLLAIPAGQNLIFKEEMPYMQYYFGEISNISHKQPIKVGISVRRNLSRGFSVETGITYAYLSSEIEYKNIARNDDQKLHYLGIPMRISWNFLDMDRFICYISAGGAIEKCIYGTIENGEITARPLQFSLLGLVGAQYNLSTHMGIYIEPGISYYFDDGSDLQTFYKERPCNFTLSAGIRLTY